MADLALLPNVLWTPDGGALENAIDGVRATITGGSTLLAQEKFRNDFQRLTSTFPSLGYRASGAVTNLEYALDPDNPSAEGGTAGTHTATNGGITVITTDFWHGSRCFKQTPTGAAPTFDTDLMAVTAASTQYTTAAMVKATAGRTIRASLVGDTSGATPADFPATGDWQLVYVTKTFAAGDTTSRDRSILLTDGIAGDTFLVDAVITVAGSTVPMFEESECVATSCTFPTPFTAGEPVSGVIFLWHPWGGATSSNKNFLDIRDGSGDGMLLYSPGWTSLYFNVYTTAGGGGTKSRHMALTDVNMPPGSMSRIAFSADESNNMRLALNGTLATLSAGATGREAPLRATMHIGSSYIGTSQLNGLILPFIYRGVAWGDEECQYMSSGAVTPYSPDRSAMYCHHPNKAIYALKAPYQYIDARRDN